MYRNIPTYLNMSIDAKIDLHTASVILNNVNMEMPDVGVIQ